MKSMIERFQLNLEAIEPKKKRKAVIFGIMIIVFVVIIGFGVVQQFLISTNKSRATTIDTSLVETKLKDGPETYGLQGIVQDNAAYERRSLREKLTQQQAATNLFEAKTSEDFNSVNKYLYQIGTKIDAINAGIEQVSLSVARERTQRRAENELIAQELDKVGRSGQGRASGNVSMVGIPSGHGAMLHKNPQDNVVELSPFDLLGFADISGVDIAHVGYSYLEYEQTYSAETNGEDLPSGGNIAARYNDSAERSKGRKTGSSNSSQSSNDSQSSEVRPDVDEYGFDAYDRGELTSVPAGSLMTAVLVSGLDAPVGQTAQSNPHPVMAKLTGRVLLPNGKTMDLRGCVVLASGYGDLSTEKVYLQTTTLSCIDSENNIYETEVKSSGLGSDGKVGLRGTMVTRDGALIARNMQAGLVQGLALAFQGGNQSFDVTTDKPYELPSGDYIARSMIGQGVSNSLDAMIQRYNRLMDQIFPVIEISAGRKIEFQVLARFDVRVSK